MITYRSRRTRLALASIGRLPPRTTNFIRTSIVTALIQETWRAVLREGARPNAIYLHRGDVFRRPSIGPKRAPCVSIRPARRVLRSDRFTMAVRFCDRVARRVARINAHRS